MRRRRTFQLIVVGLLCLFLGGGCSTRKAYVAPYKAKAATAKKARPATVKKALPRMGYTIQAGAFSRPENAARLTEVLKDKGLDATYFAAKTGLYKVRIGNFSARESALNQAEALKILGVIDEYYLVTPEEYAVSKVEALGEDYLRSEIVKAARNFLGVPYLWGGASPEAGFDCSGLTMTVYQLSGIDLPRTSGEQFGTGEDVDKDELSKGDLVFFATGKVSKVSHVGVYVGEGRFIHAPGKGKKIRSDELSNTYYYRKRYMGGRNYI